ncbi:MAG: isoleucine--tRNA ligase [Candidatus Levybacteria bacterium]|nr:isoleucine--tRNA ligase [Candidatus Levybacteria bacterium]
MFKPVDPKINFPQMEEEIIKYWKENKIFEKSVESRPKDKKWTFLDGPPFITGLPHYGSLLSSIPKDVFPRFWAMKGYRVRRVWGWDCHGLPAENKVEEKLGIKRKKDIEEKIGIKKFIDECKLYVENVSSEWEWYIDHIGRWVDFKNAYKTMDFSYMESVMWVFKQMYDKGYIYKGLRVSLYCPHCSTPISNFEVAMDSDNYKDMKDLASVYKYQIPDEPKTYILAWSTTPWNKIVTPALAVNPDIDYVKIKQKNEIYILAKDAVGKIIKGKYELASKPFKGKELIGKKFIPHYDFYKIDVDKKAFVIVGDNFVTSEEGTGVVTIAAYGEEDLAVMKNENIQIVTHLDEEGNVLDSVPKFGGMYYLKANRAVNEDLREKGLLYDEEEYAHSVPLCWRCHTRLYYAPQDAWYVNIQILKDKLKKTNEKVNWFPKHFKYGRFLKSLESAPDWNISRSRYWGSPVPVWECKCGERIVPGSIKELEELSGRKITELHKPDIDEVTIKCRKCGKDARRVPEVLDSWIEAGSASFAERHFPFDKKETLEDFFPPDFIAEYTGQIRAWFYVVHVIGCALFESNAFKNVLVEGVILGTDGRKMSKNYGNYPDPKEMIEKYGGDALRLYLLGSPVMRGEDILISEEQYKNQVRGLMLILWNVYNFFVTYASIDRWIPHNNGNKSDHLLDRWIISLINKLIIDVTYDLENYNTAGAVDHIKKFIDELSTWYIRRSRDRVGPTADDQRDKLNFYGTCYEALITLSKILAPIAPFISEEIYINLTGDESIHLADWPKENKNLIDNKLEEEMDIARQTVEIALAKRKSEGIRVRQPLASLATVTPISLSESLKVIVKDEVNVKEITNIVKINTVSADLDFKKSPKLEAEWRAREIVRKIQEERKRLGTRLDEKVDLEIDDWPKEFEDYIKKNALIDKIKKSKNFTVLRK